MAMNTELVLELSRHASFRSMGDSGVILMTNSGQLYSCNETAEAFFRQMVDGRTIGEIATQIGKEFEVTPGVLLEDLEELITYLISEDVLVSVTSKAE